MSKCYFYVVARDFGFAPNPFFGYCTLATCKPMIRAKAQIGDWIVGMGGKDLGAVGKCVFAMRVTETTTFEKYWTSPEYREKKPIRNGSLKTLVGDNIYHFDARSSAWVQADSHHSNVDGSPNVHNLTRDTKSDRVLISRHFYYFGKSAPVVPTEILTKLSFKNTIGHRKHGLVECSDFFHWLHANFGKSLNCVEDDPFNFEQGDRRYSGVGSKIL
jgi:hypothetical protein